MLPPQQHQHLPTKDGFIWSTICTGETSIGIQKPWGKTLGGLAKVAKNQGTNDEVYLVNPLK